MNKIQELKELQNKIQSRDIESTIFNEEEVKLEQSPKKAFEYAMRLLSQRDYSVFKMNAKLMSRGFDKASIEQTIDKLHSLNYLREKEYTKGRIKQLILKGYANSFILQKLLSENLEGEVSMIEEIRSAQDLGSDSQIKVLIEKKLRGKEIPIDYELKMKLKAKLTRFLVSKGFGFSEISQQLDVKFK